MTTPTNITVPSNINPLQSNGFMFGITKIPAFSYFCQEVSIPELVLPIAEMSSPLVMARLAGDKPLYGDLTINFLIDEEMNNYIQIYNWLVGMGFPESNDQYKQFILDQTNALNLTPETASYSDGVLQVLNSSNNVVRTIRFIDMFPTSLSSVVLQSTTNETNYLVGVATFGYTYYKFE